MHAVYKCKCGEKEFKTEFSQLCDDCELRPLIKEGIKNQIVSEAKIQKNILNQEQFKEYLNGEIKNAQEAIKERLLYQKQKTTIDPKNKYVGTRIMGIIWNSERIKALNKFLENEKKVLILKEENPHPRFFKSLRAFKIFEEFKETIKNPLADYSFIYRMMLNDNLIYEDIGDSEYRKWLSSEHQVEIDKTKQLDRCATNTKRQLYSSIKDNIK